ncbi:DUF748 domain-containing protein [Actinoplanes sp. TBRC 11911]|uniref:DUF748 domain-containing protein n=1 Tax=Actinoplanes sp. TBRC 11911 TaxID=2729386 RepID=UPI00145D2D61|nr:DUF748 domain-containing protein [Actinoplanes sp. TBRC 11911]NMO51178.1 DUF748 domain-containing protein [Actinoplanes sp. TBRC 11911]
MNAGVKLGAYGIGLVLIFGVAAGAGKVVGPDNKPAPAAVGHDTMAAEGEHMPGGLQIAEDGYRLQPVTSSLAVGAPRPFAFRVLGPTGTPLTSYATTHDRDLHLIVVRRDLSGFQHVHPTLGGDGTWNVPLSVAAPGQYRVFADFQPAGRSAGLTLGADVAAPGDYRPLPLPAPSPTATVDDYQVTLDGQLHPGAASTLTLTVRKDGVPVTDLQPYLGAYGHLVALRDGDLAFLHVHPLSTAGAAVTFSAEVPSPGAYRLFLDFRHGGVVRTAAFTAEALQ